VRRFHVQLLTVTVPGPDKHGNRNVTLHQAGTESYLPVDEPTFERLQPLLEALRSAGSPLPAEIRPHCRRRCRNYRHGRAECAGR
jgi:hypothetical protein